MGKKKQKSVPALGTSGSFSRNRSAKIPADHGPAEARQHGTFVEVDTSVAGVKAVRNVTVDPLATYLRRGQISSLQFQAGDLFAQHFDRARLGPKYSMMSLSDRVHGQASIGAQEGLQRAVDEVNTALIYVGKPLSFLVTHVVGHGLTAGTWAGVQHSKRSSEDGLAALRIALNGLISYYKL